MKHQILLSLGLLSAMACAQIAPPQNQPNQPLQTESLFLQNFDKADLNGVGGARDDSGWQGGKVELSVVEAGQGRALEVVTNGYAQIGLGQFELEKGATYRVRVTVSSKGTQTMEIGVRKVGEPYIMHTKGSFQSFETPRSFEKFFTVARNGREGSPARVQIEMRGTTTLTIDDVSVDKVTGGLPTPNPNAKPEDSLLPGAPQTANNLLLNSSFELSDDGWFDRGAVKFANLNGAFEGAAGVRIENGGQLYSSFMPLSLRNDYQLVVRARAVGGGDAKLRLAFGDYVNFRGNTDGAGKEFAVKSGAWQRFSVPFRPKIIEGQIAATKPFYAEISSLNGNLEIDAAEVRAIGGDASGGVLAVADAQYAPAAPTEFALTTDAPLGVATEGEAVKVRLLSAGNSQPALINVSDEDGKSVVRLRLDKTGEIALDGLKPGFYRLTTSPLLGNRSNRVEGETFLSVVPQMPKVSAADWHFGTHTRNRDDALAACLKLGWHWNRLHDSYKETKWDRVEPKEGQWQFDIAGAKRMKNAGFSLLGSLDILPAWLPKNGITPGGAKIDQNAVTTTENLRDEDFDKWREYCRRTAAAYKGIIDSWEVTNEPNLKGMSPAHYERVWREAVAGVRAGNPDARIVGLGGATPPKSAWLREVIELGGAKGADALAFHNYGGTVWGASDGPAKLRSIIDDLDADVVKTGAAKLPLIDSESGGIFRTTYTKFPNPFGDAAPRDGAAMMPKAIAGVLASGLKRWYYYAAFDMDHPGEMAAFTFTDANHTVKMPFQTMAVAIAMLEGRALLNDSSHDNIVDLSFGGRGVNDGSRVRIMWSKKGVTAMKTPVGARVVNLWGREVEPQAAVVIDNDPVYLVSD